MRRLDLRQRPVVDVRRVATDFGTVLTVQNTDPAVPRATAQYLTGTQAGYAAPEDYAPPPTGLVLTAYKAGQPPTAAVLTFAAYPSLASLTAAINALPGWTADYATGWNANYAAWASADLAPDVGAQGASVVALDLKAYTRDVGYTMTPEQARRGELELWEGRPDGYRYPDRRYGRAGGYSGLGGIAGGMDPRVGAVWVDYTAGYFTGYSGSDLAAGSAPTQVTSAARPFTFLDAGRVLTVTGGTGWAAGAYPVLSVDASGVATLAAAPAPADATGGVFSLPSDVPPHLKRAAVALAKYLRESSLYSVFKSETLGDYSYALADLKGLPQSVADACEIERRKEFI